MSVRKGRFVVVVVVFVVGGGGGGGGGGGVTKWLFLNIHISFSYYIFKFIIIKQ